jgi:hypothetical protein
MHRFTTGPVSNGETQTEGVSSMTRLKRLRPSLVVVASALVLIVATAGVAIAADPGAKANTSVNKQVKKLKKQIDQLQQRVEDLSKQVGPRGPEGPQGPVGPPGPATGPAGGDLTGTYPSPLIGPGAVESAEIADGAVRQPDIGALSVSAGKIQTGAVDSDHILDLSVTQRDLAGSSVGAIQLKATRSVVGQGVSVSAGTAQTATVTCPGLGTAIGGGFSWQKDEPNSIIYSVPEETNTHTWAVRGTVPAGSNTLYAWARCVDR